MFFYRIGFLLLLGISLSFSARSTDTVDDDKDSLYVNWNNTHSSLPNFSYELKNFDVVSDDAQEFVSSYGLGAVVLGDGNLNDVKAWIADVKAHEGLEPIFITSVQNLFELPFELEGDWPSQLEVECLTDDSLVYRLGYMQGQILSEASIDVLHFQCLPDHYSHFELDKVAMYLSGLKQAGMFFSIGKAASKIVGLINWEDVVIIEDLMEGDKSPAKNRKEFRTATGYDGIIKATYAADRIFSVRNNQMNCGVGLVEVSTDVKSVLDLFLTSRTYNKPFVKQAVRSYFRVWRKVKATKQMNVLERAKVGNLLADIHIKSKVLIRDEGYLMPIEDLSKYKLFTLFEGLPGQSQLKELVDRYKRSTHLTFDLLNEPADSIIKTVPENGLIIVNLSGFSTPEDIQRCSLALQEIQIVRKVVVLYAGDKSNLEYLEGITTLLWSPENEPMDQFSLVQMVFGGYDISGQLSSYINAENNKSGLNRSSLKRLKYVTAGNQLADQTILSGIDSLVEYAIKNKELPGCQIMMIKDGEVVYDKSFGHMTYDSLSAVHWDHIYDIASLTKVAATVPAVLKEVELKRVKLDGHLADYLPLFDESDKSDLTISKLLMHESGLKSYYPFWRSAQFDSESDTYYYKKRKRRRSYEYLKINWEDSVNAWVRRSAFNTLGQPDSSYGYLYSDIGFMLMKEVTEYTSGQPFDLLIKDLIFEPMAMDYTTFNPLSVFPISRIAPTENDLDFRNIQLHGIVHDKNTALLGGVSGHAGLFSNANDLGKYMQMILQQGYYGGRQYFDSTLVKKFITKDSISYRRALGWDKPDKSVGNTSKYASDESFGHSGFTGTLVWADPKYDLVYVFLSNRIYPDAKNNELIENNTRTRIHDIMYESILSIDNIENHGM